MSASVICAALIGSVSALLAALLFPDYAGYAVGAFAVLLCLGVSRLDPVKLSCSFLVLSVIAHTLKRAIYLLGPQTSGSYYALVVAPVCLALVLLLLLFLKRRFVFPASGIALLVFVVIAIATTFVQSRQFGALAALFEYIAPTLVFFVGIGLPDAAIGPLSRTAVRLGFISLAYGALQFIGGPTFIDRAWALNAQDVSTQAAKVFDSIYLFNRNDNLFRPHSLHSDPFAWALSLATMVALAGMMHQKGSRAKRWFWASGLIALAGLPLCLSRSPIIGFLGMILVCAAIYTRLLKSRASLVIVLALSGIAAVGGSQYLVDNFGSRDLDQNSVESRYLTVGTLSARTQAGAYLVDALREYPVVGAGLGATLASSSRDSTIVFNEIAGSHDFVVEMIFTAGGFGALCFFSFLYFLFGEIITMCRRRNDVDGSRVGSWALGALSGFVLTGFASGTAFLNYDFFLLAGLGAGWAARRRLVTHPSFVSTQARLVDLRGGAVQRKYAS